MSLSANTPFGAERGGQGDSPDPEFIRDEQNQSPTDSSKKQSRPAKCPDAAGHGLRLVISGTAGTGKQPLSKWLSTRVAISDQIPTRYQQLRSAIGKVPLEFRCDPT